ncbi:TPA: hypothetical protein ACJ3GU_002181, partial [Neisseria meningitidis]
FCFSDKFLKLKIPLFPREQKTKNRNLKSRHSRKNRKPKNSNLKFVIPAQAGIQSVRFRLFWVSGNFHFVIPAKVGIRFVEFQSFPINHRNIKFLDSRFCGNDGGEGLLFRINPCSFSFLDSRFCGNDGGGISVFPTNS